MLYLSSKNKNKRTLHQNSRQVRAIVSCIGSSDGTYNCAVSYLTMRGCSQDVKQFQLNGIDAPKTDCGIYGRGAWEIKMK